MHKRLILIIFIVFVVGGGLGGLYYSKKSNFQQKELIQELTNRIILKSLPKYKKMWDEAPETFTCDYLKKLTDVDTNYFVQNPDYFECFLSRGKVKVRYEGKSYYVRAKKKSTGLHYSIVTNSTSNKSISPNYAIKFDLYVQGKPSNTLSVLFEDTFHEAYLPERVYGVGKFQKYDDWRWDNFGRVFLVDKYLVTYRDIIEWKIFSTNKSITNVLEVPKDKSERVKPATNLTKDQMERFCAFRGKELVKAHVYDAMSFRPVNMKNQSPLKVVRGPYPWTFRRKNTLKTIKTMTPDMCKKIYTKECLKILGYEFYDTLSSTWIGSYQSLGGYLEYVENISSPTKNLKASSFYFDNKSKWHDLSERAYWDGEELGPKNFNWGKFSPKKDYDSYKVGFRCMRRINNE